MNTRSLVVIAAIVSAGASHPALCGGLRVPAVNAAPPLVFQQRVTANNGHDGEDFGFSAAIDGDTAVVGALEASNQAGAAYVFQRVDGVWTQVQELVADDASQYDGFGASVAISGSVIVVGAPGESSNGHLKNGALYVFLRTGAVWTQSQKLLESDAADVDYWPYCLSMSGDTILAGTANKNQGNGAAYVFMAAEGVFTETQILTPSEPGPEDFGGACAVDGDDALVGSIRYNALQGSVYPFERSGGAWVAGPRFFASDGSSGDQFGSAVVLSDGLAVIGAPAAYPRGSAWVFERKVGSWQQVSRLDPASDPVFVFGFALAIHGSGLIEVGAEGDSFDSYTDFVFTRLGDAWQQADSFDLAGSSGNHSYGMSLASDGMTSVVGMAAAPDPQHPSSQPGAAYFYVQPVDELFMNGFDGG